MKREKEARFPEHQLVFGPRRGGGRALLTRDGKYLINISGASLEISDAESGALLRRIENPNALHYEYVAANEAGNLLLASEARTNVVHLWDVEAGKLRMAQPPSNELVYQLAFLRGDEYAAAQYMSTLVVWNAADGAEAARLHTPVPGGRAFASNCGWGVNKAAKGPLAVSIDEEGLLRLWENGENNPARTFRLESKLNAAFDFSEISQVIFQGEANLVAATNYQGSVLVFDLSKEKIVAQSNDKAECHNDNYYFNEEPDFDLTKDGLRLAVRYANELELFDIRKEKTLWKRAVSEVISSRRSSDHVYFSDDGDRAVLAPKNGNSSVLILDLKNGKQVAAIPSAAEDSGPAAVSPDNTKMARADSEGCVWLTDLQSLQRVRVWHKISGAGTIQKLAFSPDGEKLLILGSALVVLNVDEAFKNEAPTQVFESGDFAPNRSTCFSLDGEALFAQKNNKGLVRVDLADGNESLIQAFDEAGVESREDEYDDEIDGVYDYPDEWDREVDDDFEGYDDYHEDNDLGAANIFADVDEFSVVVSRYELPHDLYAYLAARDPENGARNFDFERSSLICKGAILAVSPDGSTLGAAAFFDPEKDDSIVSKLALGPGDRLRLWDARAKGKLLQDLELVEQTGGQFYELKSIAFSSDSRALIVLTDNGAVRLLDAKSLTTRAEFHNNETRAARKAYFAQNNAAFFTCGKDGALRLHDAETGELVATFPAFRGQQDAFVVTPEGYFSGTLEDADKVFAFVKDLEPLRGADKRAQLEYYRRPELVKERLAKYLA